MLVTLILITQKLREDNLQDLLPISHLVDYP